MAEVKDLVLNIAPIHFSKEVFTIGRTEYTNEAAYRELREEHWQSHAFRYDSRSGKILNVPLRANEQPLGESEEVKIDEHYFLAARAVQQAILVWIAATLPIIKGGAKQLVFWGQADDALLLSQAFKKARCEPVQGLEVPLRYEIDSRIFWDKQDKPYLGLVIDVRTANIIELPVSELIQHGMEVTGKYVFQRRDAENTYIHPGLEPLGRIHAVKGNKLILEDAVTSTEVSTNEALLEPRVDHLEEVISIMCGPKAASVLAALNNLRHPVSSAIGKLSRIRSIIDKLNRRKLTIAGDVAVEIGELLQQDHNLFPPLITTERPILLFGPQGRNVKAWPDMGIRSFGPYMYMQHTRNNPLIAIVCESKYRGRVEQFVKSLCEGFPDELWTDKSNSNPFIGGLIGKFRLSKIRLEFEESPNATAQGYRDATQRLLARLLPESPDLALVQISEGFKKLPTSSNPYWIAKAAFMTANTPSQSVTIEKIDSGDPNIVAFLLNNVALASYAKLDGIPWVISTRSPTTHELVVGIGSSMVGQSRLGPRTQYVGITTMFQGDGRYLVWDLTREVEFDQYPTALLESLHTAIRYVKLENGWQYGDKVRLVCHVYKRLKNHEVEAVKTLVRELAKDHFAVEFAFLDVSSAHPYHIFSPSQPGFSYKSHGRWHKRGQGLAERGVCIQLDKRRALLQLVGPKDIKTDLQGLSQPLFIELHEDSDFTDLTYLVRQIYNFTYMSWRGFQPASEPVTIQYSQLIAHMLGNLKAVEGWSSTAIAVGGLRGRRWFL